MAAIFTNFAYSTLAVSINNSQTTLAVAAGHGARFPSPTGAEFFYATLESALLAREIVKVTARSTDTFTIVRAQDNTSAQAFSAGVSVALRLNAAAIIQLEAGSALALKSLTTDVNVSDATAPAAGQVMVATDSTHATWVTTNYAATNVSNVWTKNQYVTPVVLTPGASVAVDASLSNAFTLTTDQSFTLQNPTNLGDGMFLNFRIKQGAGGHVATWGTKYKFAGGSAFGVLSTAAGAVDFMSCYYNLADDRLECVINKAFA